MNIFLDDARDAPEGAFLIRPNCISVLYLLAPICTSISFDHDLGLEPNGKEYPSGYDVLKNLEKMVYTKNLWEEGAPELFVHSANPVGVERMLQVIQSIYRKVGKK